MGQHRNIHSRVIGGERHIWRVERLWALAEGLPVSEVAVDSLTEADRDCWFCGDPPTIRAVAGHCRRITDADLNHPIILHADGSLMDGGHRLARALMEGRGMLPAVRFEVTPPPDEIEPA